MRSVGALYTFGPPGLGAHYSVGAFLPGVSMEVAGFLDPAFGRVARTGSVAGFGSVLSCITNVSGSHAIAEAKWLHEFETKLRPEVDPMWF